MNILEASSKLYEWFSSKDSFYIPRDAPKILGKDEISKDHLAAINCALKEFENLGIISLSEMGEAKIWVLKKGFASFDQSVKLSPDICSSLAQIINGFCQVVENEADKADPKNITDKEIKNLIHICTTLIEMQSSKKAE